MNNAFGFGMGGALVAMLLLYGVLLLGSLAVYILKACGLMGFAKKRGVSSPGTAFIPLYQQYFHGSMAGPIRLKNKTVNNPGAWLLGGPFLFGALIAAAYVPIFALAFMGVLLRERAALLVGPVMIFVLLVYLAAFTVYAALRALTAVVDYRLYRAALPEDRALLHAVMGAVMPPYEAVCLFVLSRRAPRGEAARGEEKSEDIG